MSGPTPPKDEPGAEPAAAATAAPAPAAQPAATAEPAAEPAQPAAPAPPAAPAAQPVAAALAGCATCGWLGGLAAGLIDSVWSWRALAQFADGFAARLRVVAFTASAYATAGALLAVLAGAAALILLRGSRLGELLAFARRAHQERRARDPGAAVSGLALVLVAAPAVALASVLAHKLSLPLLARRNPDLVVALIMLGAVGAIAAALAASFVLARALEVPLAALARRSPWAAALLASFAAPAAALAALAAGFGGALLVSHWETARLLPLRTGAAALGLAAAALAARGPARQLLAQLPRRPVVVAALAGVASLLGLLAFGAAEATIKAATAYTGLGGPISLAVRRAFDRDRDGYSPLLGGGDCDDGDARIHPGAPEIPGDGIDQNCVAGDAQAPADRHDLGFAALPAAVPRDANVLLITIDTLRADHLGAYGYPRATSPALDAVAREGALFSNGWAHAPSTRYSMPAILTGRLPLDVDYDFSVEGWPGLAPAATTIAEVLRPQGFVTGAITNYWYFDPRRGMDQGFDEYDNENARLHSAIPGAGPAETSGSSAREQTDKAIAFVQRHAGKRWFLWVHYYDPHYAYEPHPGGEAFGGGRVDLYDGEIRFTDDQIGRLLAALRDRGDYDKTVVAVTGDHGEGFGEHGVDLHGYHLYAAQTRVPMIVRAPGLGPKRSETPAGHVDLLPTLANLAGVPAQSPLLARAMGRSLVDVMAGAPDRDALVWQQLSYEGNHEMRAVASRQCHVVYNVSPASSWEVYRVDRDPDERQDLAGGEECGEPRRALERWFDAAQIPPGAAQALLPGRPELASTVDVDLGDDVRLLAVTAPPRVHPGDTVELVWTFEAKGAPPPGWKVFAHVEGPTRLSADHAPVRPLEWWQRGQFIRYATKLAVPRGAPSGTYTIWAGLWRGAQRMPARSAKVQVVQDRAAVATFEVTPERAPEVTP